jgi:hypothetical protein
MPFGRRYDVWFTDKEHAMYWETQEEAEAAAKFFDARKIEIELPNGGKHLCTDFQFEERTPGEFVVFCEAPFTLKNSK